MHNSLDVNEYLVKANAYLNQCVGDALVLYARPGQRLLYNALGRAGEHVGVRVDSQRANLWVAWWSEVNRCVGHAGVWVRGSNPIETRQTSRNRFRFCFILDGIVVSSSAVLSGDGAGIRGKNLDTRISHVGLECHRGCARWSPGGGGREVAATSRC